jgi:predicted  nucleic acid-binding Zn-ribbon protein
MDEKRLDKMEEMLTSLITIVGNMNEKLQDTQNDVHEMKNDMVVMKNDMDDMKKNMDDMKKNMQDINGKITNINTKLADMHADQDHIWEKAARNERELAKLKIHLQL